MFFFFNWSCWIFILVRWKRKRISKRRPEYKMTFFFFFWSSELGPLNSKWASTQLTCISQVSVYLWVVLAYDTQIRHGHKMGMAWIQILYINSAVLDTTRHDTLPILKYLVMAIKRPFLQGRPSHPHGFLFASKMGYKDPKGLLRNCKNPFFRKSFLRTMESS